jgi:hypothetical protein
MEDRRWNDRKRFLLSSIFYLLSSILLLPGCTYDSTNTTPDPEAVQARDAQGLQDPMNFKGDANTSPYDISGGGINNFDKNAMNRDLHDALDP